MFFTSLILDEFTLQAEFGRKKVKKLKSEEFKGKVFSALGQKKKKQNPSSLPVTAQVPKLIRTDGLWVAGGSTQSKTRLRSTA